MDVVHGEMRKRYDGRWRGIAESRKEMQKKRESQKVRFVRRQAQALAHIMPAQPFHSMSEYPSVIHHLP
jgi:hypothetical protein